MGKIAATVYQKLLRDIGVIYEDARGALVRAYWGIGQRIVEEEQSGSLRARYGDKLLVNLSGDLAQKYGGGAGFSLSNLKRMRQFYLLHPKGAPAHLLTWAHHMELLPVRDPKKRRWLEKRAVREGLNRDEVRALIHSAMPVETPESGPSRSALADLPPPRLLVPVRGRLHTHKIVEKAGGLYLDMGFRIHRRLTPAQAPHFKKGDIVELGDDGKIRKIPGVTAQDLYTYEAELDRVYDADTQWYFIFTDRLDARGMKNDKLRLRGIDCPELSTAAGTAAKKFAEELFERSVKITVATTKPDKFDRYLSDVYLTLRDGSEIFLNNELLARGHARLFNALRPEDWEK